MVSGDSREELDSPVGREDEEDEEEKLLKQAIALSLEGNDTEKENYNEEDVEAEEEELLRQAIALSLEGAEEEDD